MEAFVAVAAGVLFTCGLFCLLQGHFIRIVTGVVLLSNAVNLLIFSLGGIKQGRPPLIGASSTQLLEPTTNPLAGAMILTSIVISLGLTAFVVSLIMRSYSQAQTSDYAEFERRVEVMDE